MLFDDENGLKDKGMQDRLVLLRQEHRDLDMALASMGLPATGDALQVQRLKKQKLRLRDEITRLEDQLYPDIIA